MQCKQMQAMANMVTTAQDCPQLPDVQGVQIRHCAEYPGYAIGDDGSAWSCRPCVRTGMAIEWRQLTPFPDKQGYLHISCQVSGRLTRPKIGHLVASAFIGPRPGKLDLCHGDGNNQNNHVKNLRWGTRSENMQDAIRHGTFHFVGLPGERHPQSKLTQSQVDEIRRTPSKSDVEWARELGVTKTAIYLVRTGKAWKHESDHSN
jgi:hypothetical protein